MKTLRFKLTASYLLVTFLTFILIGIFANSLLENQFEKYVVSNLNRKNTEIVATLKDRYTAWGKRWDVSGIENIGMSALGDGLIVRVSDAENKVVWDAMKHNSGMCAELLQRMAENMKSRSSGFHGGYTEKNFIITEHGKTVGQIAIGYYGPYFYTENDIAFLNTLNKMLIVAAAIAGILAFGLGTYMAGRLSTPISKAIRAAEQISEGNFQDRIAEKSTTTEIVELTQTINRLADTLGKQEQLRKRMTADVAHELRTPIANLQSHLEAMIDGIWKPDTERLSSCHDEAVRLAKIVGDLETLARYDGENMTLHKVYFELSALVRKISLGFQKQFQEKQIEFHLLESEQFLTADQDKVTQVLVNLISNALKYTTEGGKVEVKVEGDASAVRVRIKDSGIGIAEEDLPYIFERFYRADQSRSRATGGSGIGLAIAKSLTEAHGGRLLVTSVLGEGSEFVVEFMR